MKILTFSEVLELQKMESIPAKINRGDVVPVDSSVFVYDNKIGFCVTAKFASVNELHEFITHHNIRKNIFFIHSVCEMKSKDEAFFIAKYSVREAS